MFMSWQISDINEVNDWALSKYFFFNIRICVKMKKHPNFQTYSWSILAWPFLLALLSLIPKMNHFSRICYRPWSLTYWCLVMAFIILLFGLLAAFWVFNYVMQKKPHLWSNSANDTTSLISTSSGFHSARFAGSRTQCSGREVSPKNFLE